jgi:hypothetical protein
MVVREVRHPGDADAAEAHRFITFCEWHYLLRISVNSARSPNLKDDDSGTTAQPPSSGPSKYTLGQISSIRRILPILGSCDVERYTHS